MIMPALKVTHNSALQGKRSMKALGVAIVCATLLSACSIDSNSDLKEYVASVKARPAGKIPPLPTFETYVSVPYAASNLRDPFLPFMDIAEPNVASSQPSNIRPPITHKPQPLENYPLDALKYVGLLERQGERWGIIVAPDKLVHHVRVGDYLGQNNGKVTSISETKIELMETVSNGMGGWVERPAAISVVE